MPRLRSLFENIEYDTKEKRLLVLEAVTGLVDDCASEHDRSMLLMAFDIISNLDLVTYE